MTVKYKADRETPTNYTGYIVNGNINVPMNGNNAAYQKVQAWIADGNTPEPAFAQDEIDRHIKDGRYLRLEKILSEKTYGLKKLAIDKPYMQTRSAIDEQFQVYERMYENAKKGAYSDDENTAIIAANEGMKAALAPVVILLNNVRSVIEYMIEADPDNVDAALDAAEAVHLTAEEITPEKLTEIAEMFGL